MNKILTILVLLLTTSVFAIEDLIGKNYFCDKFLWGFEFISSSKVKVIRTNLNNITSFNEYYYEIDNKLNYINIYLIQNNKKEFIFSLELNTFRVDIWTMTSGGNTVREIIPEGFCKFINVESTFKYIEDLKKK